MKCALVAAIAAANIFAEANIEFPFENASFIEVGRHLMNFSPAIYEKFSAYTAAPFALRYWIIPSAANPVPVRRIGNFKKSVFSALFRAK